MRIRSAARARWRQVPVGMRDQTAEEVAARRRLERRLLEVFQQWGYEEVATPTLEYLDTLLHGAGPGVSDRLLKFVDTGGEVLALRPEMTVPLARFAATRLLPAGRRPLRLAYASTVFRAQERGSGRPREFTQAGVELIGDGGVHADVEVIALAGEALGAAGVRGAAMSLGHAGFLRGVLATLAADEADAARDLLYRRAFAELGRVVPAGPALDVLRLLPALRGPDALDRARPLAVARESREALDVLAAVLDGVAAHDLPVRIEVDLGLIRDFDYYSGVVFEAYGARAGMALLGGGRYDDLLARFGQPAPATGFAIGVEPVLDAAVPQDGPRRPIAVFFAKGNYAAAVPVAARLRRSGFAAVLWPAGAAGGEVAGAVCVTRDGLLVRVGEREVPASLADVAEVVSTGVGRA
ncbi:MAG: ATP phosphoribosyltransferase regulatory subunit [Armatimonadota bacterium]|nr:ATP phosphoribosyltransferase regulatory subunit [Armatimonadota bacterium]